MKWRRNDKYFPRTEEMSFWIERDNPISGTMNLKIHTKKYHYMNFRTPGIKSRLSYKDFQRGKAAYTKDQEPEWQ